jgi:tetratricopeptide (TPR) repeat protein
MKKRSSKTPRTINQQAGDNATQIGFIQGAVTFIQKLPKWLFPFLLVIVSLLGLVLLILVRPLLQGPGQMNGRFNIAVAAFDVLEDGKSKASEDGERLANDIYMELLKGKDSYPLGNVVIWGPDKVGRVSGADVVTRDQEARIKAQKIGANVLVYGILDDSGTLQLLPEFYINELGFADALELTGNYPLGNSIPIDASRLQNPVIKDSLSKNLSTRSKVFSLFTIGLFHYALRDYKSAYDTFLEANHDPNWSDNSGKEIIYLFLGNAANKLSMYDDASSWFDNAIKNDPDYARVYIGKGETYYQQAIQPLCHGSHVDIEFLNKAIHAYQQSLNSLTQDPHADIPEKAHFGIGRSTLMKTEAWLGTADRNLLEQAERELKMVTNSYEAGNVVFTELAAQAYGQLGLLYYFTRRDSESITAYESALAIESLDSYKAVYIGNLKELYSGQGNKEKAAEMETQKAMYANAGPDPYGLKCDK